MKRYIATPFYNRGQGRDRLRELLKNESVDTQYELLINARERDGTRTGVHEATEANDLECIRYMLDGFPSYMKYWVLKIQNSIGRTPLHLQRSGDIHQ